LADETLNDLIAAVDAVAATFDGRGSRIKERELEMALETALWALGREPRCQQRVRLEETWAGRVGGVDLALQAGGDLALIELKWDPVTLAACAWDQVKLAAALQSREGSRAFLIAGSPLSAGLRGDELLEDDDVEPIALRARYAKEFDYWKRDVQNHPRFAPSNWQIQRHHAVSFDFAEQPWQIRLAELELTDTELVPFE
jgi:hypothetical protein